MLRIRPAWEMLRWCTTWRYDEKYESHELVQVVSVK